MKQHISLIAALTRNKVIGKNNTLPWRLPADLKYFKSTTRGHAIIMGRKNYQDIGRPLPDRTNIVISRSPDFKAPGCIVVNSIEAALDAAGDDPEIFVIGGAHIYEQMLPFCDRMYLTLIDADIEGDTYFPEYAPQAWQEISRDPHPADQVNAYPYTFIVMEKAAP